MFSKTSAFNAHFTTAAAAALTCVLAGNAVASDHNVTVTLHVSTQGLDLRQPADARAFYTRLENAAWVACTRGNRADLVPVENPKRCYEDSLGSAIRAARQPLLTQIYLSTHTLQEAALQGIDNPVVAAK